MNNSDTENEYIQKTLLREIGDELRRIFWVRVKTKTFLTVQSYALPYQRKKWNFSRHIVETRPPGGRVTLESDALRLTIKSGSAHASVTTYRY